MKGETMKVPKCPKCNSDEVTVFHFKSDDKNIQCPKCMISYCVRGGKLQPDNYYQKESGWDL